MEIDQKKIYSISDLRYLMERLRDPEIGCPWDIKQTYSSLKEHTLEEAYEVVDTIDRNDFEHLQGGPLDSPPDFFGMNFPVEFP